MKYLLSLLPWLLACHSLAQSQTASVTAYCRSLCLSGVTVSYGDAIYAFNFTTAKGARGQLQYLLQPDNTRLFSHELRPVTSGSSRYEGDFELMVGNTPLNDGTLTLTLPTATTNPNRIPASLDPAQTMYAEATGTGATFWPSSNYCKLDLRFSRAAGSATGAFSGIWTLNTLNYIMNGSVRLMLLQGTAAYTRGRTNQLQLSLTRTMLNGTTDTLTGTVNYTATANQLSLPRFTLTSTTTPGHTYTALPCVLNRQGQSYTGNLSFVDGAPETPWPDYVHWILSLSDPNDTDGNGIPDLSDPKAVHIPRAPLALAINGQGTVSPALNGHNLELGATYRLTATPAPGYLFTGWTGGLGGSAARTLTFTMVTNLTLQANFALNPFYSLRGTYYGLITDTNYTGAHQPFGGFTATTTAGGAYSLKVQLDGQTHTVSGAFDATGSTSLLIVPANLRPLFLELHLDLTNHTGLSGLMTNGTWSATLHAHQLGFHRATHPCGFAGKYTFALSSADDDAADDNAAALPLGHSYGTATVDAAGRVRCSGWLADGTRLTHSTGLSGTGDWPLYAPLYGRKGFLAGWLTLTNFDPLVPTGLSLWWKPAATTRCAPEGFTNWTTVQVSPYAPPPAGQPLLDWTHGLITFSGGNLAEPFTTNLTVGDRNKLTTSSPNQLSLRLLGNGLFQGRVTPPGARRPVSFQGALLQQLGRGYGYLPGTPQSGAVTFGPELISSAILPGSSLEAPITGVEVPPYTNLPPGDLEESQLILPVHPNLPAPIPFTPPPAPSSPSVGSGGPSSAGAVIVGPGSYNSGGATLQIVRPALPHSSRRLTGP